PTSATANVLEASATAAGCTNGSTQTTRPMIPARTCSTVTSTVLTALLRADVPLVSTSPGCRRRSTDLSPLHMEATARPASPSAQAALQRALERTRPALPLYYCSYRCSYPYSLFIRRRQ